MYLFALMVFRDVCRAVYAMGFYMDENAAKQTCSKEFACLPPASLERNQALAERVFPTSALVNRLTSLSEDRCPVPQALFPNDLAKTDIHSRC